MLKEKKGSEVVMTEGYTDGEEMFNIPPTDMQSENLRTDVVTQRMLVTIHEDEVIILCNEVGKMSIEDTIKANEILEKGIKGDIPTGLINTEPNKTETVEKMDEGR